MIQSPHTSLSISDKAFDPDASIHENLRRIRAAGFTHLHFAWKWTKMEPVSPEEESMWLNALEENDMKVLDVHGCHPKNTHLWSESKEQRETAKELFLSRLHLTHRLGGDAMAYHVPWEAPVTDREIHDFWALWRKWRKPPVLLASSSRWRIIILPKMTESLLRRRLSTSMRTILDSRLIRGTL